jgi:hypothetical protein
MAAFSLLGPHVVFSSRGGLLLAAHAEAGLRSKTAVISILNFKEED